mgnify:FL=1
MASNKNKSVSIRKYKNRRQLNLGIFLFAIVFIYLIVTVILYFTGDTISVYEVREGSIVRDNSYTGLILRQETAVTSEGSGYISYYQNEDSKVKAGTDIYALSQQPLNTDDETAGDGQTASISQEVLSGIALQIQNFNENYKPGDFSAVYSLKNEINNSLQETYSETRMEHLGAVIEASGQEVSSYTTARDGIVAFTVDGYEGLTKDTFQAENFDITKYETTALSDQMKIETGDPVYRLITSEDWSVIVPLDKETTEQLISDEVKSIKVRIDKDSETMRAALTVIEKDGGYYGCLDFDNSMIRYADERFLNVELILEDESGLKIPKSSVIEEKFYVIPEDYITTGGNSSSEGVMIRQKNGSVEFTAIDIYDRSEDKEVYISRDELREGDILVMPESSETYTAGKTKALKGVYNINKGYAVFKKVSILCENDEYYIVQEGESYGLYNYDHIVQNGTSVSSDEVVFQ